MSSCRSTSPAAGLHCPGASIVGPGLRRLDVRHPRAPERDTGQDFVIHRSQVEVRTLTEVRLDKWLWAARLFKTRQVAAKAVAGGHAEVNGTRAKPARMVRVGDVVRVRKGPYTFELTIQGLSQRRGPASDARTLYAESEVSVQERGRLAEELRTRAAQILYDTRKPGNRDRRQARSLKREQ